MKDLTNTSNELVAQIFADYHQSVFFYIYKKIGKKEDAEDLVQDAISADVFPSKRFMT